MKENDVIWVSIEESDKYKAYCIDGIQYLVHRLVAKYFVINKIE